MKIKIKANIEPAVAKAAGNQRNPKREQPKHQTENRPRARANVHRPENRRPPPACGKITFNKPSAGNRPLRKPESMYQSDITQFINQMKEKKPTLEEEQRKGRALLWDKKPIDLDERSQVKSSRVEQTGYVYYQNF
jgi:hypothetical protein